MKVSVILPLLATLATTVTAENHYWCACQQSSGSSDLIDKNTKICCGRQGGSFPSYQDVSQEGTEVSFSGNYVSGTLHNPD
ncbi:hypothetical protein ETB97_008722 [Aspergillus alliaceus]|uniref:Uncharacterized protein n=1 Tax=Petromyces alliaceus TaxID=209559 RepID=A0A5N6FHF3_PETAA|nr:uncharacterized protein BDW43DRAFT_315386 [Aspergillus alliaceus]KAB8229049.1 hypothetical protein BDW43DRAFT_315386 [Aspergillus alliaceus]KAF5866917.1 hypothetical protein ETB97_008722 [Aspergillus burnettii]